MFEGASAKVTIPETIRQKGITGKEENNITSNLKPAEPGKAKWNMTREQRMDYLKNLWEKLKGIRPLSNKKATRVNEEHDR